MSIKEKNSLIRIFLAVFIDQCYNTVLIYDVFRVSDPDPFFFTCFRQFTIYTGTMDSGVLDSDPDPHLWLVPLQYSDAPV